jgi:hypothetical protein
MPYSQLRTTNAWSVNHRRCPPWSGEPTGGPSWQAIAQPLPADEVLLDRCTARVAVDARANPLPTSLGRHVELRSIAETVEAAIGMVPGVILVGRNLTWQIEDSAPDSGPMDSLVLTIPDRAASVRSDRKINI